ncbi:MAG TPA: cation diffusion facilitator family transporter [Methanoregulaceae archaeon]|nr:cation diffusion facilitator family transporter [Methanoregulaceae archaeon]
MRDQAAWDLEKLRTARLSVASNSVLLALKLAIGLWIGSVAILSEAVHSGIDLVAAVVAWFAVRASGRPPDLVHQFGHGKFEDLSGLFEGALIMVAAVLIISESVQKLLSGGEGLYFEALGAGIAVMAVSSGVNWYVSNRLMRVAKSTESIALESDAWHLRTDVYTSLGVLLGLVAIRLTGVVAFDAVIAIGVALLILKAGLELCIRAGASLIDERLPDEEEERIRAIIAEHGDYVAEFHELRTRRSGPNRFVDLHLCVARSLTVEEANRLADRLEEEIRAVLPRCSVVIKVEPCDASCEACRSFCTHRGECDDDQRSQAPDAR